MAVVVPIISTFDSKGVTKAIADFKKLDGAGQKTQFALGSANKAVSSLAASTAKFGGIALGVAGVLGKTLVNSASNLQESISKINAVFGSASSSIITWSQTTSKQLGISQQAALEAAGTYGNLFQAFGLGAAQSKEMSIRLVELAADMASFNNVPVEDALTALRSGLSGETEPLKRFGVALNDATLKEEAMRLGLIKTTSGTLPTAIKTQAAYSLILKQTAIQQGDVERTSDGIAFKLKSLGAQFEDIKSKLGDALLPVFTSFVDMINESLLPRLEKFANILGEKGLGSAFKFLAGDILKAIGNMGTFGNIVLGLVTAMVALRGIMIAATIAQVAFNVALFANPIGIAVAAVIAFIAVLVALALKFKVVRDAFATIWNSIVDLWQFNINLLLGAFEWFINDAIDVINVLIRAWNRIPFTSKVGELEKVNLALDITKAKVGGVGDAAAKAGAQWRKFEGFNAGSAASAGTTVSGGGGGITKTVQTLTEKFKKFADAARTVTSNQKSLRDALKNTASAQKQLQTATDKVAAAQDKLNRIAKGYGATSKEAGDAQKALNDAQRDSRQASLDMEKANFAVTDAELALIEARKEGDPRQIREAEIALEEAKMALADANTQVMDTTNAVTDAQKKLDEVINGASTESDIYKDALAELKTAQEEQVIAIDNVRDAKERELETTRNLAKAELILLKAKGKLSSKQLGEADALLAELGSIPSVTVPAVTGTTPAPFDLSGIDWSSFIGGIDVGGIGTFAFANGGIVTKPVLGLIGETGESEAVIPLSRMGEFTGGSGITVNVSAGVGDPVEIGRQVVVALQAYQRRSGSLPLKVS